MSLLAIGKHPDVLEFGYGNSSYNQVNLKKNLKKLVVQYENFGVI